MTENRIITCVVCPTGCSIHVTIEDGAVRGITGNKCGRGADYAAAECAHPVRTLTSTVSVAGPERRMLPVKSDRPLPKELLLQCMNSINSCTVETPVDIGDIVIENILGTGVNIVATGRISQ